MPPFTIFRYLLSRMTFVIIALYAALAGLVFIADFMESLRFAGKFADGDFGFAVRLTALRTPALAQLLTPFVFLFGSLWLFTQLNRRSELSVLRSVGLSIWRLIAPPALFALLAGGFLIMVVDPAATEMTGFSEQMKNDIRGKPTSTVRIFGDGIWMRQREDGRTILINAASLDAEAATLSRVTLWRLDADASFIERIDAPKAVLKDNTLELIDASLKTPDDKSARRSPSFALQTALTVADFREGAPAPEAMSIWDLPRYVRLAEAAGLPTVRYDLRFHDLCATPLKLVAMVMIAALFSLKPVRSGGALKLILAAVGVGFVLYVVSEISSAMGESGVAPAILAAWAPPFIGAVAAITGLLHIEEG